MVIVTIEKVSQTFYLHLIETLCQAMLLAEEEERKQRDEEEKRKRIEAHREKKRLEKQVKTRFHLPSRSPFL